ALRVPGRDRRGQPDGEHRRRVEPRAGVSGTGARAAARVRDADRGAGDAGDGDAYAPGGLRAALALAICHTAPDTYAAAPRKPARLPGLGAASALVRRCLQDLDHPHAPDPA